MITQEVLDAIAEIVDYNWRDEARDYEQEGQPDDHVFGHLLKVARWLDEIRDWS